MSLTSPLFASTGVGVEHSNIYVNSARIQAYPCSRRRSTTAVGEQTSGGITTTQDVYIPFDPEAKLTTEETSRHLTSVNGYRPSYVESIDGKQFILVIDGYRFKIEFDNDPQVDGQIDVESAVRNHSIASMLLQAGDISYDQTTDGDCIYANILLEERRVVHIEHFRDYNTWIIRNQSYNGAVAQAAASLDVQLPGVTTRGPKDPFGYYFTGLTFSTKPLTYVDQATVVHADVPVISERLYQDTTVNTPNGSLYIPRQRTVSLKVFERINGSWVIHNYARLPEISHGEFDNSVELGMLVANNDIITKTALRVQDYDQDRLDRFIANDDGKVYVHDQIKVVETPHFNSDSNTSIVIKSTGGGVSETAPVINPSSNVPYIAIVKPAGTTASDNYSYQTQKALLLTDKYTENNYNADTPPANNTNALKATKSKLSIDRWDISGSDKLHYKSALTSGSIKFERINAVAETSSETQISALKVKTPWLETNKINVVSTAPAGADPNGLVEVAGKVETETLQVNVYGNIKELDSEDIATNTLDVYVDADIELLTARTIGQPNNRVTDLYVTNADITDADIGAADIASADIDLADITTADITTAGITTAAIGTAGIGTANITTANVETANIEVANITTANVGALNSKTIDNEELITTKNLTVSQKIGTTDTPVQTIYVNNIGTNEQKTTNAHIINAALGNVEVSDGLTMKTNSILRADEITGTVSETEGVASLTAKDVTITGSVTHNNKSMLAYTAGTRVPTSGHFKGTTLTRLQLFSTNSST